MNKLGIGARATYLDFCYFSPSALFLFVFSMSLGYPGLEPETSPLSGARSTTELIALRKDLASFNYELIL